MKPITLFSAALTLSLFLSAAEGAELVKWDIPTGSAASATVSATTTGVSATAIVPNGSSVQSTSSAWRTNNYDGDLDSLRFSVSSDAATSLVLDSLIFTARVRAASGTGDNGEWTDPELILEYSDTAAFTTITGAGILDLGPTLLAGGEGAEFTSDATTFFTPSLNIAVGTTVFFRLRASNATGLNNTRNQLYLNSTNDMILNGTATVASVKSLVWSGANSNNWNTTELNFLNDATASLFSTGDEVTVNASAAIVVDAGGVVPTTLTVNAATGTVGLSGGNISGSTLTKSGGSTLAIDGTNSFVGGVSLTAGVLRPVAASALGANLLSINAGTLNIPNTVISLVNNVAIGTSGGVIDTDANVTFSGTFSAVVAAVDASNQLTKSGVGVLTINKTGSTAFGAQSNLGNPGTSIEFDISGGGAVFSGNGDRHLGGTCTWDAPVTVSNGLFMLHGATLNGSGAISLTGNATIESRFNRGASSVNNAINVASTRTLTVDAPAGNSDLAFNGVIDGDGSFQKIGNGIVFMGVDNSYTGTTTVDAGILVLGNGPGSTSGMLGTGAVTLNTTSSAGTLEVRRDDAIAVSNVISGSGNVTLSGGALSSTELNGSNDYAGITSISGGTLVAPVIDDGGSPSSIGASFSDPANLVLSGGGILSHTGATTLTNRELSLGAAGGGGISANGSGPLTFDSTSSVVVSGTGTAARTFALGGSVVGVNTFSLVIPNGLNSIVSIVKRGTTTWALTSASTYTGSTTVENGVLVLDEAYLNDTSTVSISSTGKLNLTHGSGDTIDALFLNGVQVAAGTYGSTAAVGAISGAVVDNAHFIGNGYLVVMSGASTNDFNTWASGFLPADVSNMGGDNDGDGLTNGDEYAFGLSPIDGSSVNPIAVQLAKGPGTFSYTRRDPALTGLTYAVETSTTLGGWMIDGGAIQSAGATDGAGNQTVVVTLSTVPTDPKFFVRVTTGP